MLLLTRILHRHRRPRILLVLLLLLEQHAPRGRIHRRRSTGILRLHRLHPRMVRQNRKGRRCVRSRRGFGIGGMAGMMGVAGHEGSEMVEGFLHVGEVQAEIVARCVASTSTTTTSATSTSGVIAEGKIDVVVVGSGIVGGVIGCQCVAEVRTGEVGASTSEVSPAGRVVVVAIHDCENVRKVKDKVGARERGGGKVRSRREINRTAASASDIANGRNHNT